MPNPTTPTPHDPVFAGLQRFNDAEPRQAQNALLACCGSEVWAEAMIEGRPYPTPDDLFRAAEDTWFLLPQDEWLVAFGHHPRIGERYLTRPNFAATAEQSAREQAGMAAATDEQRREFEELNERYERRFGHVFLICASGKSPGNMLDQLRRRLANDAHTELHNAAAEQAKITRLRLERMLSA